MAQNSFKQQEDSSIEDNNPKGKSLFALLDGALNLDRYFGEGIPMKHAPKVVFLTLVALIYISNSHFADKTIRRIEKLKTEVEDMRADYTTLKASYMYDSKQSEVAKKVKAFELEESKTPPYKMLVNKEELENLP